MTKRKAAQAGAVVVLAAAILLAGTFAWSNFAQSRVNTFKELMTPDVNLHDDFEGGPNKDVYVENSGQKDIFVRVKMTEYLQTANLGSLVLGHTADQENLWVPHNTVQAVSEGTTTYDPNQCDIEASGNQVNPQWTNAAGQDFHDFYTWTLGGQEGGNANGQIYYKPAPEDKRAQVDANGNIIQEPQVVSDELTGVEGDAAAYYAQQLEGLEGEDLTAKMAELGVKQTLTAQVYTMEQWKNGIKTNPDDEDYILAPYAQGDFWVIDTDGWAYWANPLHGGEATGLLLDKVTRTENKFDSDAEYKINVQLQAVTADDIAEFGTERGGGISKDALRMMKVASGTGVVGVNADGVETLFVKNADGTYTPTDPESGEVTDATAKYIFLTDEHSIQDGKALKIGDDLSFTELEWDGENYTNFDAAQGTAPLFNMSKVAGDIDGTNYATSYQLTGAQVGVDGKTYLILQAYEEQGETDKTYAPAGEPIYLGAVDRQGEADPGYTYSQTDPGKGPFAILYPTTYDASGNAIIGTGKDLRVSPNVTILNRSFRLLGNGVYEETTETAVAALAEDTPAKTFFFAGKYVTKSMFSGVDESNVDAKVNTVFPLQLTEGDWFTFGVNSAVTDYTQVIGYTKDSVTSATTGAVQFETLEQGADGNYYIKLAGKKNGYIGPNDDGFLAAPSGGTTSDKRAWANPATGLPIGSVGANGDVFTQPEDFTEPFLKGKTSEELSTPGTTFTVNGFEFVVLDADKYGNRFIAMTGSYNIGKGSNSQALPDYPQTLWVKNGTANAFADQMSNLKPYIISADLPAQEKVYPEETKISPAQNKFADIITSYRADNVSTAVYSTKGAYRAFPLSVEEYLRFIYLKDGTNDTPDMSSFRITKNTGVPAVSLFRDKGTAANVDTTAGITYVTNGGNYETTYANNTMPMFARLAMWVRFSDADSIATATANELAAWKAAGKLAEGPVAMTVGRYRYGIMTVQDGKAKVGYFGDYVTYRTGKTFVTNWWKGLSGEDAEIKEHAYMPDSTAEIKGSLTQDVTSATSSRPGAGECPAFIPLYQDLYPSALNDIAVMVWTRSLNADGNESYMCNRGKNPPYELLSHNDYYKKQILACVWVDWDWAMTKLD